jgi:hypothetical protein
MVLWAAEAAARGWERVAIRARLSETIGQFKTFALARDLSWGVRGGTRQAVDGNAVAATAPQPGAHRHARGPARRPRRDRRAAQGGRTLRALPAQAHGRRPDLPRHHQPYQCRRRCARAAPTRFWPAIRGSMPAGSSRPARPSAPTPARARCSSACTLATTGAHA